ncbi:helix-turn-helix domain-containing protein [Mucilaginibacter sabulilitoris]|uniref:Helix-turn-helix domain-containing protein n=1 Tax=Mucilaginibacter sabulilitoris TaxID=1173583 RepID=A0ABZ0TVJ0_9SPHI|nr:helix-turn-helix domain-containing protein [Mucilaginibacter sabulilitoris]WPU96939.1 helix-turn-helix domain-containing protein [Mucilaginibacter sabulilitoris]
MNAPNETALINPLTNALAFKVFQFRDDQYFKNLNCFNFYTVILIRKGSGQVIFDLAKYDFDENTLIRFPVYVPFQLNSNGLLEGVLLQFHPDFFWNHRYQKDLPYKQALFKNIDEVPLLKIDEEEMAKLLYPLDNLLSEVQSDRLGRYDITIAWTKIFMIYASRIKMAKGTKTRTVETEAPYIIRKLIDAVEEHFYSKHRPADYAALLNVTMKKLNRVARQHLSKTIGDMISERLIAQAKYELYVGGKPVKQIARELGFRDVSYFSRFFKMRTATSPHVYRESFRKDRGDPA